MKMSHYTIHSFCEIDTDYLTAIDLSEAVVPNARAYSAIVASGDDLQHESVQALLVPDAGRIGIAWGAPAVWGDIREGETVQQMIEEYLRGEFDRRV